MSFARAFLARRKLATRKPAPVPEPEETQELEEELPLAASNENTQEPEVSVSIEQPAIDLAAIIKKHRFFASKHED